MYGTVFLSKKINGNICEVFNEAVNNWLVIILILKVYVLLGGS